MVSVALVVKIIAKPGQEEAVASFLSGALPLAEAEEFTPVWYVFRADRETFYIVDAFANDAHRTQHLQGQIAAALMASADALLASPPRIEKVDVLAAKR